MTVDWLQITHGTRKFGAHCALDEVNIGLDRGEIGVLLGPSGCGKTTTLRIIAGLERLDSGTLAAAGRVLQGGITKVPAEERGIGLVFQDHALFPHLGVRQYRLRLAPTPRRSKISARQRNACPDGLGWLW